jgi:hypothetical protein
LTYVVKYLDSLKHVTSHKSNIQFCKQPLFIIFWHNRWFFMHNKQLESFPYFLGSLIVFYPIEYVCRLKRTFLHHQMSLEHILTNKFFQEQMSSGGSTLSTWQTLVNVNNKGFLFNTACNLEDTLSPAFHFTTLSFQLAFFIKSIDSCRGSPWVSKRFIHPGSQPKSPQIQASKQQTQMGNWLQGISQFQSVHCRSWLLLSRFPILLALVRGARVLLESAAYRIALNVGLAGPLFFVIKINLFTWGNSALTSVATHCSPWARQVNWIKLG